MAPEADKKGKEFSAEEKLRAADKDLSQLREILASMDEIDALRKRDGKPETGEYGGYKRADVTAMIAELEQRRRVLLADISNSGRADSAPGPSGTRERVTLSDALERMYAAIAGNIEHAKGEILREIRYSCRQNTAIYAELSARMDAVADKVLAKVMAGGVDYDELAKRIVLQMTGRGESDAIAALEKRIEELEAALAAQRQAAQSPTEGDTNSSAREAMTEPAEEQTAEEEELFAEPAAREAEPGSAEGDVAAADAAAAGPQSAEPIEEPISGGQTSEEQLPEESGDLAEEQLPEESGDVAEEQLPEESGDVVEEQLSEESGDVVEEQLSEESGDVVEEQLSEESGDFAEEEGAADAAGERVEEEIAEIPGEDNSFERESAECEAENEAENAEASAEPSIDAGEAEADLAEEAEAAADSDEIQREEADGGIGSENENADPSEK